MRTRVCYVQKASELNSVFILHQSHEKTMMMWHQSWLLQMGSWKNVPGTFNNCHWLLSPICTMVQTAFQEFATAICKKLLRTPGKRRLRYIQYFQFSGQLYQRNYVFQTYRWWNYIFRLLNFLTPFIVSSLYSSIYI